MSEENFLDNPFYIALTKQYKDLYSKACKKNCVICIPKASSLPPLKSSKRPTGQLFIRKDELALHILYPSCMQAVENGLFDCVQSGYSVKIDSKNGLINGYSGFARNFTAKILSEEKCYDDSGKSFTVLIIDRQLGEGMDIQHTSAPSLDYSLNVLSVATCEEFLRNTIHPSDPDPILFKYKKAIEQLYLTYQLLPDYLEDLAGKINRLVNIAIEEVLKVVPKASKKDVKAALEIFGHGILHKKIFQFLINNVGKKADELIRRNFHMVKKPDSVGGLDISKATFSSAEESLQKIVEFESPLQQLLCITNVINCLQQDLKHFHQQQLRSFKTTMESVALTGDDTLSLLLYIIAHLQIPHLPCILKYIQLFCNPIPDAALQYSFTTFEAAVKYLENPSQISSSYNFRKTSIELSSSADEWDIPEDDANLRKILESTKASSSAAVNKKFGDSPKINKSPGQIFNGASNSTRNKTISPLDNFFGSFGTQK